MGTNKKGLSPEMGTTDTYNGGVNCHNSHNGKPKQMFIGWMSYNRFWWDKDLFAMTLGGGQMNNPGRYLTLLPPINGATAITGTPYYTENAGDRAQMHDGTITFDYMPSQFITFRLEKATATPTRLTGPAVAASRLRAATTARPRSTPAPAARLRVTAMAPWAFNAEARLRRRKSDAGTAAGLNSIWWPDLRTNQTVITGAIMVRF
jgi:hypothetical protein